MLFPQSVRGGVIKTVRAVLQGPSDWTVILTLFLGISTSKIDGTSSQISVFVPKSVRL